MIDLVRARVRTQLSVSRIFNPAVRTRRRRAVVRLCPRAAPRSVVARARRCAVLDHGQSRARMLIRRALGARPRVHRGSARNPQRHAGARERTTDALWGSCSQGVAMRSGTTASGRCAPPDEVPDPICVDEFDVPDPGAPTHGDSARSLPAEGGSVWEVSFSGGAVRGVLTGRGDCPSNGAVWGDPASAGGSARSVSAFGAQVIDVSARCVSAPGAPASAVRSPEDSDLRDVGGGSGGGVSGAGWKNTRLAGSSR